MAAPSGPTPPPPTSPTPVKSNGTQPTPENRGPPSPAPTANPAPAAADASDKMAPRGSQRGGGRGANAQRREADLSALLSAAQKSELVLLAASITNAMQDQISQVFDDQPALPLASIPANSVANGTGSKKPAPPAKVSTAKAHLQQDRVQTREEPVGMQGELKKEALAAFQKWQAAITKRVSEISVAKDQVPPPSQAQGRATNGKQSNRTPGRGVARSASTSGKPGASGGGRGNPKDTRPAAGGPAVQASALAASTKPSVPVAQLPAERRQLLLHAMILLVLSLDAYPAYSRIFIARVASHFRVPPRLVAEEEARIALALSQAASSAYTEEGLLKKTEDGRKDRRGRSSATTAALTLAPPLHNAKIGSLAGCPAGIGSAAAATVVGTMGTLSDGGLAACMFFGICGPRGSAPKTLDCFTKDVQDAGLVLLHGSHKLEVREGNTVAAEDRRLRLSIGIGGWIQQDEDAAGPWRVLGEKSEAYALRWEQETLAKVGSSLNTVVSSMAWQNAKKEFANRNVFSSLKDFTWPRTLLKISKLVDNPWSVGMVRADKVGMALADAITNKVHGERGVSLLGYGLGARAIYTCLMSLSERRVFGQVENVLMMGTPAPSSHCVWRALRSAVSGRVINVFSENDLILGFLHRTGCVQFGVAGLQRIQGVHGIENVDASKPVTNHLRYSSLVGRILRDVGWEDLDMREVVKADEG